jgi:hypothetical protein
MLKPGKSLGGEFSRLKGSIKNPSSKKSIRKSWDSVYAAGF